MAEKTLLKEMPVALYQEEAQLIKHEDENGFFYVVNYFEIKKDGQCYITAEPVTMIQLMFILSHNGLAEDREIRLLEIREAEGILSEIKKEEKAKPKTKRAGKTTHSKAEPVEDKPSEESVESTELKSESETVAD